MKTLQWLLAGILVGVIAVAYRDLERGRWIAPPIPWGGDEEAGEAEPVLGYDGMDQETLLEWLAESNVDRDTVEEIIRYEEANLNREPVLQTLEEMLG